MDQKNEVLETSNPISGIPVGVGFFDIEASAMPSSVLTECDEEQDDEKANFEYVD